MTNKGQEKLHLIQRTNPETGAVEQKEISQADYKVQRETLKADGWTRVDGDGDEVAEPTSDSGS